MGKTKLKESFKSKYNMTITEHIQRKRINVVEHMLLNTGLSIMKFPDLLATSPRVGLPSCIKNIRVHILDKLKSAGRYDMKYVRATIFKEDFFGM